MSDLEKYIKQLETAPISEVRKVASTYKIKWSRDMTQQELLELIAASLSSSKYAMTAVGDMPEPGWARIIVHADPSPHASNNPLYVSVNDYSVLIPREREVDVPAKVAEVLANAKSAKLKEDPTQPLNSPKRYRFVESLNYPFSLVSHVPGPDPRDEYERNVEAARRPRVAFKDRYGYWPRSEEELRDAIRSGDLNITAIKTT